LAPALFGKKLAETGLNKFDHTFVMSKLPELDEDDELLELDDEELLLPELEPDELLLELDELEDLLLLLDFEELPLLDLDDD
jgi:hypothetical protein